MIEASADSFKILPSVAGQSVIWNQTRGNIVKPTTTRTLTFPPWSFHWHVQCSQAVICVNQLFPSGTWDFADPAVINDTVSGVETTMKNLVLVEVGHSTGDVGGKRESVKYSLTDRSISLSEIRFSHFSHTHTESRAVVWPEAPVDGDVVVEQDVRQTSFGTVLRDDANVRHLDAAADELAQIGVVQFPEKEWEFPH